MSHEVICLSDSDDESVENKELNTAGDSDETEFSFPPVNFHYRVEKSKSIANYGKESSDIVEDRNLFVGASVVSKSTESWSNNDGAGVSGSRSRDILTKYNTRDEPREISAQFPLIEFETESRKGAKPRSTKNIRDNDVERIRAKEQVAMEKHLKALEKKKRKNMQPGECLKFIRVNLDRGLEKFSFHSDILTVLRNYDISYQFDSLRIPNSVTWIRKVESYYVNSSSEVCEKIESQTEGQIIVVWGWDETVRRIEDKTFNSLVANIASLFPDRRLTLVLYGMDEYFARRIKLKKSKSARSNDPKPGRSYKDLPRISRYDLEVCLAEIQLTHGCSSRLVETAQELAMLVYHYTKAIAEIPFKVERRQKIADKVDWYAMGDKTDTVRVDKNGIGLKRLWQQQICKFNLATLETAEAICSVYPSPQELMRAYATCTPAEGEQLLRNIPIRRAAGPLSTVRKIGPELSKKIFIMFTSQNGDATLGNDRES